jgi:uncharacterized Rossmann fold enzyme
VFLPAESFIEKKPAFISQKIKTKKRIKAKKLEWATFAFNQTTLA